MSDSGNHCLITFLVFTFFRCLYKFWGVLDLGTIAPFNYFLCIDTSRVCLTRETIPCIIFVSVFTELLFLVSTDTESYYSVCSFTKLVYPVSSYTGPFWPSSLPDLAKFWTFFSKFSKCWTFLAQSRNRDPHQSDDNNTIPSVPGIAPSLSLFVNVGDPDECLFRREANTD